MFQREIASIEAFGFVDPITVRESGPGFEIIDGEHRWRAATQMGIELIPVWSLGQVPDEIAQQLTIVLNETRGEPKPERLAALVRSLSERVEEQRLRAVLPFSAERFAELSGQRGEIDFGELRRRRDKLRDGGKDERWVERVFRMPAPAAEIVDQALERILAAEGIDQAWRALEMMAADYLASA